MALTLDDATALAARIESIISNPQIVTESHSEAIRCRLRDAGRKLSLALEKPNDTIHRIAYSVGL